MSGEVEGVFRLIEQPEPVDAGVRAVAVGLWRRDPDHTGAVPDHAVPTAAALVEWLPDCPPAARVESDRRMMRLCAVMALDGRHEPDRIYQGHNLIWERGQTEPAVAQFDVRGDDDEVRRTSVTLPPSMAPVLARYMASEWKRIMVGGIEAHVKDAIREVGAVMADIHSLHTSLSAGANLRHPLAPLVEAWQRRPLEPNRSTVTVVGPRAPMVRRPKFISTALRTPWIEAVPVDGAPMTARIPDGGALFDRWNLPKQGTRRRHYRRRGEQHELKLPGVPPIRDVRLVALAALDPRHKLIDDATASLAGDVLTIMAYAHAVDRPMTLSERDGAALLARTRDGDFRRPLPGDVERFRLATVYLRQMIAFDPDGGHAPRWLELAHVATAVERPDGRWSVEIGPPAWARPITGQWTLTAEGSAAGSLRPTAGEGSMAGRIITGIEYRLAARYDGQRFGIAPDLRPQNGRAAGPGRPVHLPWRHTLHLAGDWWDENDPAAEEAARKRFQRAVAWLCKAGYFAPHPRAEAPAGDSVEVLDVTRGARSRTPTLSVRASARFVEAARLSRKPDGAGFQTIRLIEYAGMDDPAK